jgi:hypothetical protein
MAALDRGEDLLGAREAALTASGVAHDLCTGIGGIGDDLDDVHASKIGGDLCDRLPGYPRVAREVADSHPPAIEVAEDDHVSRPQTGIARLRETVQEIPLDHALGVPDQPAEISGSLLGGVHGR